jgi:hypothetical protein
VSAGREGDRAHARSSLRSARNSGFFVFNDRFLTRQAMHEPEDLRTAARTACTVTSRHRGQPSADGRWPAPEDGARIPASGPSADMRLIFHRRRVVALAGRRLYFAPHIDVLEPDHPERRFVAALCMYSHAVDTGRAGRPYRQCDAERFARTLLLPAEDLRAVAGRPAVELAETFGAPLDQVRARLRECQAGRTGA